MMRSAGIGSFPIADVCAGVFGALIAGVPYARRAGAFALAPIAAAGAVCGPFMPPVSLLDDIRRKGSGW